MEIFVPKKAFAQECLANLRLNDCNSILLTGGGGKMIKAFLVELFARKIESDVCHLSIIAGTLAMNCGISSNNFHWVSSENVGVGSLPWTATLGTTRYHQMVFFIIVIYLIMDHICIKCRFKQEI